MSVCCLAGVTDLINNLTKMYPDVKTQGCADPTEVYDTYRTNIFTTWAAIQFNLTSEQIATGKLITDENSQTIVDYTILINANDAVLPSDTFDDNVYNDQQAGADLWWASGYMTVQNFVSNYLAQQYSYVPNDFQVCRWLVLWLTFWCLWVFANALGGPYVAALSQV
jgi:hypothetical protein